MRNIQVLLIALVTMVTAGCPQPKNSKSKASVVLYKGDPKTFYAGTQRKTSSPFSESRFGDMAAQYNLSMNVITNVIDDHKRSYEGAKREQDPNKKVEGLPKEFTNGFTFRHDTTDNSLWLENGSQKGIKFNFELNAGNWSLKEIKIDDKKALPGKDFEIVHYSIASDANVFSLLLYDTEKDEKNLTALYFVKDRGILASIEDLNLPYNYLLGRGLRSSWKTDQPVQIDNCSSEYPSVMGQWLKDAVKSWQGELSGHLELVSREVTSCPPFSDVNSRTFKYVEGWIEIPGEAATLGLTQSILSGSDLIDSDIFIMMGELQEGIDIAYGPGHKATDANVLNDSMVNKNLKSTVLHEMGHFLGLHHVFDGTNSVMSYSDTNYITEYDRKAVQGLYPLKTNALSPSFDRYFR